MNKQLDEQLCKDFPEIFRNRHGDRRTTAMCWGFDCGDGWEPVIRFTCKQIMSKVNNLRYTIKDIEENLNQYNWANQEKLDEKKQELEEEQKLIPVAAQVKEKFGGLRFYVNGGNDRVWDIIQNAESLSYHVCEECGTMKNVRTYTGGWHRTLCDEHANENYGKAKAEEFRKGVEE